MAKGTVPALRPKITFKRSHTTSHRDWLYWHFHIQLHATPRGSERRSRTWTTTKPPHTGQEYTQRPLQPRRIMKGKDLLAPKTHCVGKPSSLYKRPPAKQTRGKGE